MTLEELANEFTKHVIAKTDALGESRSAVANRHTHRYFDIFKKLREHGEAGRDALAVLLKHARMDVRVKAAIFLLSDRPSEALPVLEEAAKGKGMIPFEASYALKYWKEGTWYLDVD